MAIIILKGSGERFKVKQNDQDLKELVRKGHTELYVLIENKGRLDGRIFEVKNIRAIAPNHIPYK